MSQPQPPLVSLGNEFRERAGGRSLRGEVRQARALPFEDSGSFTRFASHPAAPPPVRPGLAVYGVRQFVSSRAPSGARP